MKFPYGMSDFYQVSTEGYFYIDRTGHIRRIEEMGKQLLFLRPRRFGKSLWLSTLENYYDLARKDEFERLFGHLAIGRDPTRLHNRYFVLKWDFSAVDPGGDIEEIRHALHDHINGCIEQFVARYQGYGLQGHQIVIDDDNALRSFQSLLAAVQQTPHRLYLLIDEYDNFANEIMSAGQGRYYALVSGEGMLKTVFKAVKAASTGQGLERVFITGVSPVVMSDITSGYNIAKNVYLTPALHNLCGFTDREVWGALSQVAADCGLTAAAAREAMEMVRTFYNGYRFSYRSEEPLYNPTLALYFLDHLQEEGRYPEEMLDSNLAMDRAQLEYVARLPNGRRLIVEALEEQPPPSVRSLSQRFGLGDMLREHKDISFMASLLYYLGILSLDGRTASGRHVLRIPNVVVRRLYAEQIRDLYLPPTARDEAEWVAEELYTTGDIGAVCEFIEDRYFKVFDNRDYRWANELTVKTAFLTLLFNDVLYIMDSEPALERCYADLVMIVRPDMRQYDVLDLLIEFKYISLKELGMSGAQVREASLEKLRALPQVAGQLQQAHKALQRHRQALENRYGDLLRLRTYAVVALGFDRLVWQETEV